MVTHYNESIFTVSDVLSTQTCEEYIAFSEQKGYEDAKVGFSSGAQMRKDLRNNLRLLYQDNILAHNLWEKVKIYIPQKIENMQAVGLNDMFRFYKYNTTQRFRRHIDGRYKNNVNEESRLTFMIYLNDDFEGGETAFDEIIIKPQIGMGLFFVHELKHQGCPVETGTKYVLRTDIMYKY